MTSIHSWPGVGRRLLRTSLLAAAVLACIEPALAARAGIPSPNATVQRADGIDDGALAVLHTALAPDQHVTVFVELDAAPAARVWQQARRGPAPASAPQAARSRIASIERSQRALQPSIEQLGGRPLFAMQRLANAMAVHVPVSAIPALAALPGVARVELAPTHTIDNASGTALIGAPWLWHPLPHGVTGAGMRIGIIDTGVDYVHTGFGGSGDYSGNDGVNGHGFPTAKVVGGFDFAGNNYDSTGNAGSPIPQPDADPLDCHGHGSHVAGTAAGFGVNSDGSTYAGPWDAGAPIGTLRIGPGVAPEASIYALKVFGCSGSTALTMQAVEWAVDPDGDGDFSDRLDVINLSLGTSYGSNSVVSSQAVNNAAMLGVVVVASAGNNGDYFYVTGSPGAADWAISTASSVDAESVHDGFEVNSPAPIAGIYPAGLSTNYNWTGNPTRTADLYYPATNRGACSAFSAGEMAQISGRIVVVDWTLNPDGSNQCGSTTRAHNVSGAGGVGSIMVWPGTSIDIAIAGNLTIPAIITNAATGDLLKTALLDGSVNATLTRNLPGAARIVVPDLVDSIATTSSRGPRVDNTLKPDVTAPGHTIFSVASGSGNQGRSLNGTSMAAPHVAGGMVLLRQLRPDWSVEELKALLINSAHARTRTAGSSGPIHSPSRQGAGRVILDEAATADVVAFDAEREGLVSVSFGALTVVGTATHSRSVRLVNKGAVERQYALSTTSILAVAGVSVQPAVSTVTVPAGGSATVELVLTADAAQIDRTLEPATSPVQVNRPRHFPNEHSGHLHLTAQAGGPDLQLPYHAILRPATEHAATPATLRFGGDHLATQLIAGTDVSNADYLPMLWALQWQHASPAIEGLGIAAAADLQHVGVGSGVGVTGGSVISATPLFFGIASHGSWATLVATLIRFNVYIDSNRDGNDNYVLFNTSFTDGNDVLVSAVTTLANSATALAGYINRYDAVTPSEPMNSGVMVMPTTAGQIGLSAANSRFNYRVETLFAGVPVDTTPTYTFDLAAPAIHATGGSAVVETGVPVHLAGAGTSIVTTENPASRAIDQPLGLLVLHQMNHVGMQAQAIPFREFGVALDPAASTATGLAGTAVLHALTITNTGNDADTFQIDIGPSTWDTSAPPSVVLAAGASATIDVTVEIPAGAMPPAADSVLVTVTSIDDAGTSAAATITTEVAVVRGISLGPAGPAGTTPGASVVHTLSLHNTGNVAESFAVSLGASAWPGEVASPTVSLAAGESASVAIMVTVPADAVVGSEDALVVTVGSDADAGVTASQTLITRALSARVFRDGFED